MRILFYISTIRGGGAARVMVNVANGLAEEGCEVFFVTNFPADHEYALQERIERRSLESAESKSGTVVKNASRISALRRIIRETKPDVCVAFMAENNFRLLLAARGLGVKTVVSVRNDPAREYPTAFSRRLADALYKKADGVVFQTEDARAAFPAQIREKSRIILNQVDEAFFSAARERAGDEGEYLLSCGRLSRQKNYPMLLRGFAEILKTCPEEQLRIYGEGALEGELVRLAQELGIASRVRFMGYTTQMPEVYQKAKLLLMTSDYEGLPNAILEALASGVPAVATDCPCGGPKTLIRDGENGYLVPVGDHRALARRAAEILSDEALYQRMRRCAQRSGESFSPAEILLDWRAMLEDVCRG